MAKSTKFLSIILVLVMLALVASMAILSWTIGQEAHALADADATVYCYLNAPTDAAAEPQPDANYYYTDLKVRFSMMDAPNAEPVMAVQQGATGVYTATNIGAQGDAYRISYSLDGGNTWAEYNDNRVDQVRAGFPANLFFYQYTFKDSDGSEVAKRVFEYNAEYLTSQFPTISAVSGGKLFRAWRFVDIGGDYDPTEGVTGARTLQADRVDIDPNNFKIDDNNNVIVYGTGSNSGLSGIVDTYADANEAIDSIVKTYGYQEGDNPEDINITITMAKSVYMRQPCNLGKGNYTLQGGPINSGALNGAFELSDKDSTLILEDLTIVSSNANNGGITLDQGTLKLQGASNPGGLVLTENSASANTNLNLDGATELDAISLYYLGDQTIGKTLDRDVDADTPILKVSGDASANFTLKNANNSCGMSYNAQDGVLYIEEKYAVSYQKSDPNEEGSAPATQYVLKGTSVAVADLGTLDKRGHQFEYWYDEATPTNTYAIGQELAPTGDVTLRAYWTPITYTITFIGVDLPDIQHVYGVKDNTISTPAKTGYTFDYWLLGDTPTIPTNDKITLGATQFYSKTERTITLTAKWLLVAPTVSTIGDYQGVYDAQTHSLSITATHPHASEIMLYEWYLDGTLIDSTSNQLSVKDVQDSGTYTCKVRAYAQDPDTQEWQYSPQVTTTVTATISKVFLGITADNVDKKQGDKDPVFTYRITLGSMPQGETLADLDAHLVRVEGEEPGRYEIRFIYTNNNYQVSYTEGYLTIQGINILAIVLPSVFGGLALIGAGVATAIILIKKKKRAHAQKQATQQVDQQAPIDPPKEEDAQ